MTRYRTDLNSRTIQHGAEHIAGYFDKDMPNTVEVLCAEDAAGVFAHRAARRRFGKRGYCHHVREDLRREDGRWFNYEAFIGVDAEGGGTSGHNIRFTVHVE